MTEAAHRAVELAARDGYGRLVAWLAARCGDLTLAEDAVGDALEAALKAWPERGVPNNPEAWLLTAARRKVIDRVRRRQTRDRGADELRTASVQRLRIEATEAADTPYTSGLPDRRLELMFLCAHPDIAPRDRTPLMLQTVLGLDAARIGSALLVKPATLGQRLVRAKRRIKEKGLAFEVPPAAALPARLADVLEAIYAAFGTGWEAWPDADEPGTGLAWEAIWLARLLVGLMPEAAEAKGLLALMLLSEARRVARRSPDGLFVPLEEQDTGRWDADLILEGEKALWMAAQQKSGGPYQLEASIQSLHAHRAKSGRTDWNGVCQLYAVLAQLYPSLGGSIGYAASLARVGRPEEGLQVLDALPETALRRHQPAWAVRAFLLKELGRADDARHAYRQAMGLCEDEATRRWLAKQASELP
ncbi:MAG: RNA polymerase subunit sigma-70 [Deltaproteobacteria bacterium]|nr:RNA polymerase subunit sigma-70 [Deltaproteobacteria bacterium]